MINQDKQITGMYDYMPFGEQIPVSLSCKTDRLSFIGKEQDKESSLHDLGVRKYDNGIGKFLSIDPLWEKYLPWSPYHYCGNNPVNAKDPSGMAEYYDANMKLLGSDGNSEDVRNFITSEKDFLVAKDKKAWGDIQQNLIATKETMALMKTANRKTEWLKKNELAIVEFHDGSNSGEIEGNGPFVDVYPAINAGLKINKSPAMTIHWHLIKSGKQYGYEVISEGDKTVQKDLIRDMKSLELPPIYNAIMINPNNGGTVNYYNAEGGKTVSIPFYKYVGFYDK